LKGVFFYLDKLEIKGYNYIMDFWLAISFFFAGALLSRFVSRIVDVSHASIAFNELDKAMLTLLIAIDKDVTRALDIKYKALNASDIPPGAVGRIRRIDEKTIAEWRNLAIKKVILSIPPSFYRYVKYENWEEAKKVAQKRRDKKSG
jgi:hypothetical protein